MPFKYSKLVFAAFHLLLTSPAWAVNYNNSTLIEAAFSATTSRVTLTFRDQTSVLRGCTGFESGTNLDAISTILIAPLSQQPGSAASKVNIACSTGNDGIFQLNSVFYKN